MWRKETRLETRWGNRPGAGKHFEIHELRNAVGELFKNDVHRSVLHVYSEFDSYCGGKSKHVVVEGSITWLARLDVQIATVIRGFTKREVKEGHLQKLYSHTYARLLAKGIECLTENICV